MKSFMSARVSVPSSDIAIDVTLSDGSQLIGCFWDEKKQKYIHIATNGEFYIGEIVMWRENNRLKKGCDADFDENEMQKFIENAFNAGSHESSNLMLGDA